MSHSMSVEEKLALITERIPAHDIYGLDLLKTVLEDTSKTPRCLWVTSPTGKPHVGYFIPLLKFADFLKAGCEIVVVLLDVYSFLDNVKYPMSQVLHRMHYYKFIVMAALEAIGIPSSRVRFVQESSYHMTQKWIVDQWTLCTLVPQQAVRDAWDRSYNPNMLSPMFCPGIQTLAEEHLDIDFQFGGEDQRGIFEFAERFLPQLGYRNRTHLMNPMLPNILGGKMSSSHPPNTKLMFLDDGETIRQKIMDAPWQGNDMTKNGILTSLRDIIFPVSKLRIERRHAGGETSGTAAQTNGHVETNGHHEANGTSTDQEPFCSKDAPHGTLFTIDTEDTNGRVLARHYKSYSEIEQELAEGLITPEALKIAVANAFNILLAPVRKFYKQSPEWQEVDRLAYPEAA